jgi:hypothetical protein
MSVNSTNHDVPTENVKMIQGKEYAVLDDTTSVYWNGSAWVASDLRHETVVAADTYGVFTVPWVGIVHNPMNMPKWFDYCNSPQELWKRPNFQKSLKHCLGLIVFSEDLKHKLKKLSPDVPIEAITHPTELTGQRWIPPQRVQPSQDFSCGNLKLWFRMFKKGFHKRRLVQVGYWLRRLTSIWEVEVPWTWTKYWINRAEHGFTCLEKEIFYEKRVKQVIHGSVETLSLSNSEYDRFLSRSVMFIDLYDSSCNNTIVEAIVRHVPIVVRRLPATVEYLGEDYCLFFDSLDEVHDLLHDERVFHAHTQLKMLEESGKFYGERFVSSMRELTFLKFPI